MTSEESVRNVKQLLRNDVRTRLKTLTPEEITEQSQLVWDRLFDMKEYQDSRSISVFLSMASELSTAVLIQHACRHEKTIYVPRVGKNFEQADMDMIRVPYDPKDDQVFYKAWPRNKWGIPEPPPEMPCGIARPGDIDLVVVPGLAFDSNGGRLGQGKGYYDRFIARFADRKPKLVAVALACQKVDEIPVGPYDQSMDYVIFPNETIQVNKIN